MSSLEEDLARLEREDPDVRAASEALDDIYEHLKGRLPASRIADIYNLDRPLDPEVPR